MFTKCLQELDHVTHENAAVANQSSSTSNDLKAQAQVMTLAAGELLAVVNGQGTGAATKKQPKAKKSVAANSTNSGLKAA